MENFSDTIVQSVINPEIRFNMEVLHKSGLQGFIADSPLSFRRSRLVQIKDDPCLTKWRVSYIAAIRINGHWFECIWSKHDV